MVDRSTCIFPSPAKSPEINYNGKEAEMWLGELPQGMKVRKILMVY